MKNYSKLFMLALVGMILFSSTTFAGVKEKAVAKANAVVQNASPDDWKTLAAQADYLIKKEAGLATAKNWLDKSLAIKESAYGLEVFGDYYLASNLPVKAIGYYIKSMDKIKEGNPKANTTAQQDKILLARGKR